VSDGILGGVRLLMTIEEHGGGKQLVRFRCWPKATVPGASMVALFSGLGVLAGAFQNWGGLIILGGIALVTGIGVLVDCAAATSACLRALRMSNQGDE
jgi:preprotein translocase subunit SecY